jgi:hypothetical protein
MSIEFHALPTETVQAIRTHGRDAYGNAVERHVSDGEVYPCRHCLGVVPMGKEYLILAHRPFKTTNAYAETGPIFLCSDDCARAEASSAVPGILRSPGYILRAYSADERIRYGTGRVVPTPEIAAYAADLLADPGTAFVDVRSAANNCFQCRVKRA